MKKCLHLQVDLRADAATQNVGNPTLWPASRIQVIGLAGRGTGHIGLPNRDVKRLIQPAARLENRGQQAARSQLGKLLVDVAHLGGQQVRPIGVAVAKALISAVMALRTQHSSDFQLDQRLQAMAHQLRDQIPGCTVIQ